MNTGKKQVQFKEEAAKIGEAYAGPAGFSPAGAAHRPPTYFLLYPTTNYQILSALAVPVSAGAAPAPPGY
jgi:hypothetical protein